MKGSRSTYRAESDEYLMEQVAAGDAIAFDELYERYSGRLLRYFFRMLGQDEEKAQDFLQDLFVKIVEKPHLFDPRRRFSTWVFSVAANMCKNEYRSQEVRKIITREEDLGQLSERQIPPEARLDGHTFQHRLQSEIADLRESHRAVFLLRFQQELSIKEISQVMDCSEGTVKSRIFYTLRRLADRLEAFNPKPR